MIVYKIIGIGITGAILSLLVKQYRPDFAIALPILTAVAIFVLCVPYIETGLKALSDITDMSGIDMDKAGIVIKIIGGSYIFQFASDICVDAGERSVASKIELSGKLVIIAMSMPIIYRLLDLVKDIINF